MSLADTNERRMFRTAEALAKSRFTSASSDAYFVGTLDPSRIASVSFLPIRSQSESVHILSPANIAAVFSSKSRIRAMNPSHSVSAAKQSDSLPALSAISPQRCILSSQVAFADSSWRRPWSSAGIAFVFTKS